MFCPTPDLFQRASKNKRSEFQVLGPSPGGPEGKMRKAALGVVVVYGFLLSSLTFAQDNKPVDTFPLNKIQAGMHGVAYTVFQGTKPEPMDVEVLGVLKNANGPKGDIILVRL